MATEDSNTEEPYNREEAIDRIFRLKENEKWWRDRYQVFLSHGYELRPRLRPGWIPSWRNSKKRPGNCEDSIPSVVCLSLSPSV